MTVVVVGAGLAGVKTAEALRDKGFADDVVLLSEEEHEPYDRPPLSKHVLRGDREPMPLRAHYDDVDLRLGVTATGLTGTAVLTTGGDVAYDQLVVATGAAPRRLPGAPGLVLRTLDDSRALAPHLQPGKRIGVVGAGLIGCEVAASARVKGAEVHVVDVLPAPLVRVLGPTVAQRVQALHEEHGVAFHLGTGVASATATSLDLTDGTHLDVDVVLEAMGAVPVTGWVEGVLPVDDGVVCDTDGRVTDRVWAVGDVARWGDRRLEHWTSAAEQGAIVAAGIAGEQPPAHQAPYWWSDQYDLKLAGIGLPAADDAVELLTVGPRQRTVALYSREGRLTGVVGFSAGAVVMRLRDQLGRETADVVAELSG